MKNRGGRQFGVNKRAFLLKKGGTMGLNDKELSRIRMLANNVIARSNTENPYACAVGVRRDGEGARVTISYRSGKDLPDDYLSVLGDLADTIRTDLRLEKTRIGNSIYGTGESTFESGANAYFTFEVWLL